MTSEYARAGLLLAWLVTAFLPVHAQNRIGQFDGQADVGKVKHPGSATYNPARQEYTIVGSGTNIWFDHDEFHFVWKRMKGDFILQTNGKLLGKGVDPHRKLGWMVRSSLDSNSAHVNAVVHGDGLTSLQFRRTKGAATEEQKSSLTSADVIQLARKGNTYTMSVARNGQLFVTEQVTDLNLGDEVYVGLFVCSHNPNVSEKAVFHNVRLIIPARDNFVPYREYIGSDLELMDVATGHRKIIYHSPESIQAPNWLPNNKALIYNHNGKLYRFDLAKKTPSVINTDFAVNNNNDHVLSFDGKMLGISNHVKEEGNKSIVFTMPVEGGTPKRITPLGHSYLHSWSPDGKSLIYTGQRDGEFDIYRIPSNGGQEVRLTTAKGLDDGSEYSPDGQFIYFNSTRSGTMQIWRMNADGSNQVQVTNDEFNNWFPHISPDGKWIVILSFGKDVSPDDHPFYKQVYLRLLPVSGTTPARVIAYVYGGQGTINTPSWSPDSKQIAFISNTDSVDKASVSNK
ncbi:biopolymer transporter TolR [Spirosoma sp. SC4-14]|uniref:TolB family protein n=1 Tax=Spirosoma sp. SC4-14 TaxID=3128900 RepID=UPI0030D16F69